MYRVYRQFSRTVPGARVSQARVSQARVSLAIILCLFGFGIAPAMSETRSLWIYNVNTKETRNITYKKDGKYLKSGLKNLNYILRDFRQNEPTEMDMELLDLLWQVYQKSGSRQAIHVVSGYRSERTNELLRRRSRNVARRSQHIEGKAIDFRLPDVPASRLRELGLKEHKGGVGYYKGSFVHLDTGSVRHWPTMSRQQLARVFPKGQTIHLARGQQRLSGYRAAETNLRNGLFHNGEQDNDNDPRSLIARLLQTNVSDPIIDDEEDIILAQTNFNPPAPESFVLLSSIENIPIPHRRPTPTIQLALVSPTQVSEAEKALKTLASTIIAIPTLRPDAVSDVAILATLVPATRVPAITTITARLEVPKPRSVSASFVSLGGGSRPAAIELHLGDLSSSRVKSWILSTSTRTGPMASVTAPNYEGIIRRALPASVWSGGFSTERSTLRSDRFSGQSLTKVAFIAYNSGT